MNQHLLSVMKEPLLSVEELAAKLKIERSWIYDKTRRGEIPMLRVGKYCRFRLSEVLDWLDKKYK